MSTEGKCYLSPAKINLFLHILNRRADGYHELQTVFQLLDFGDELTSVSYTHLTLPTILRV